MCAGIALQCLHNSENLIQILTHRMIYTKKKSIGYTRETSRHDIRQKEASEERPLVDCERSEWKQRMMTF